MLTGRALDAAEGQTAGLSQYQTEEGGARARAVELAERSAGNAPLTNFAVLQAPPGSPGPRPPAACCSHSDDPGWRAAPRGLRRAAEGAFPLPGPAARRHACIRQTISLAAAPCRGRRRHHVSLAGSRPRVCEDESYGRA